MEENNFTCGYCGKNTTSVKGMSMCEPFQYGKIKNYGVYICTHCNLPTFMAKDMQVPGIKYGSQVKNIPNDSAEIYNEARSAFAAHAYTGVVLLCRKLLMHIAVELGAEAGLRFIEYVNYLEDGNYITSRSKDWVDSIRKSGNESTHEIKIAEKQEAERIIKFSEMILKTNFEYPAELDLGDDD